jgi:hypothetical protein
MKKFTIYVPNTRLLETVIEEMTNKISCFIDREYVEMNYSKVEVTCRAEDSDYVLSCLTAVALLS